MRGRIKFDDEKGCHTVTDEYGDVWDQVYLDGADGIFVREDSQTYYGAEWCADAGGSNNGELMRRREGNTYDGVDTRYEFDPMRGWKEVGGAEAL